MARIPESELIINSDGSVYHLNLKPGDISDTIITVGDPGRVYRVSNYFDSLDFEMNRREFITHTGNYKGKKISVISTGMGTDNIEILMTELDAIFNVDLSSREPKKRKRKLNIIRIGTSGGIQQDLKLGTFLASDYAIGIDTLGAFYNFPQDEIGEKVCLKLQQRTKLPFLPYSGKCSRKLMEQLAFDMKQGNTLTAPGFYAPQGRKVRLAPKNPDFLDDLIYFHEEDFWLTNFEMETSAYYGLGALLGHEMLSLNVIIANRVRKTFSKNYNASIDKLIKIVLDRI